jgi:hypothetical protein
MRKYLIAAALLAAIVPAQGGTIARDAGNIGDTVTLRYPRLTILCKTDDDAFVIYLVGVTARAEAQRVENTSGLKEEIEARKYAMRKAHSCEWPQEGANYILKEKILPKDANDHNALRAVRYSVENNGTWIFYEFAFDPSPFSTEQ